MNRLHASMLTGPAGLTFFRYGIPWAVGFLLLSSAGLVDAVFLGRYAGSDALSAINLTAPVYSFFSGVGILLSTGGTVSSAKYVGEGNFPQASAIFSKTMFALLLVSLLLAAAALLFTGQLLHLLGARDSLTVPARIYLRTIMCFGPVLPCAYAFSQFARVDQQPALASLGLVLSAVINIVLDFVFIAVCKQGVLGAALATGIGFSCMLILFLGYFFSKRARLKLCRPQGKWRELFLAGVNGGAEFINEMSIGAVMLFLNRLMIDRFGTDGVAAFTVINYGSWFGLTLAYGLSDTLAPLVSASYGARLRQRVRALLCTALYTLSGLGAGMFALFTFYPEQIIYLFVPDNQSVAVIAAGFIGIYRLSFLFSGVNMGLVCYFTGLHHSRQAMCLALLRSLLLPLLLLAVLPLYWGADGIYAAIPAAEALTLASGIFLLWRERHCSECGISAPLLFCPARRLHAAARHCYDPRIVCGYAWRGIYALSGRASCLSAPHLPDGSALSGLSVRRYGGPVYADPHCAHPAYTVYLPAPSCTPAVHIYSVSAVHA